MNPPYRIPLARPSITDAELEAQARALRSGRLVLGRENEGFELRLATATGRPHAVAVGSGTSALYLGLWALDLPPGGEVLVPAFTFPAPAHAACALGLRPVPVDVDPGTWNVAPSAVSAALSARTCALIAVDQFGLCADYDPLLALCRERRIPLIEDAACAVGAADPKGRRAGSFGVVSCLSFHPRKIVTTGEGGAVLTSDGQLAERLRRLRHHGQSGPGCFVEPGLNLRLAETAAAVGSAQLDRLPVLLAERRRLEALYWDALTASMSACGLDDLLCGQVAPPQARPSLQTFAVVLPPEADRALVAKKLAEGGIEAGPATYALSRIGSLMNRPGCERHRFPVAEALHDRALALPFFNGMSEADLGCVAESLAAALTSAMSSRNP